VGIKGSGMVWDEFLSLGIVPLWTPQWTFKFPKRQVFLNYLNNYLHSNTLLHLMRHTYSPHLWIYIVTPNAVLLYIGTLFEFVDSKGGLFFQIGSRSSSAFAYSFLQHLVLADLSSQQSDVKGTTICEGLIRFSRVLWISSWIGQLICAKANSRAPSSNVSPQLEEFHLLWIEFRVVSRKIWILSKKKPI
jgi:hypothetical protein